MTATTLLKPYLNRSDVAVNWLAINPVLRDGEIGFEKDTGLFKIGRAGMTWNALAYAGGGASSSGAIDGGTASSNYGASPPISGGGA